MIWLVVILLVLIASGTTITIKVRRRCAKCGCGEFQVRYSPAGQQKIILGHPVESDTEAMLYICQKCGYQWFEEVKH